MEGDDLPDGADIVHYVSPSRIDDGIVMWQAFIRRSSNRPHSGHWLNVLQGSVDEKMGKVRDFAKGRYETRSNGRYAQISVSDLRQCENSISVVHKPLMATDDCTEDPSHCDIIGLPAEESDLVQDICERIVKYSVKRVHLAVVPKGYR